MIDLRNTCVLVRTKEENEMLLKEAEKQGFHWYLEGYCKPLPKQHFPDILKFYNNKDVVHSARIEAERDTFYEASELLGTKEMTVRAFIEQIANTIHNCSGFLKSGKSTVPTSEEKAISILEKFIENPDRTSLNDEFVEALKLVVEKLKEVK